MINLTAEFKSNKTILVVIPTANFPTTILDLTLQLNNNFNRITYVSLNKLINPLRRSFEDKGLNLDKFFFVDAITKTAMPDIQPINNCIFVPSPEDLTKLSIAITKSLQNFDPDCLIFDSLSTLLIYLDLQTTNQFIHSLVNKISAFGIHAVFTSLQSENEQPLQRSLSLILDRVVVDK